MIIGVTADTRNAYSLSDSGEITQYKLGTTKAVERVPSPGHASTIVSIEADDDDLHAIYADGAVYRRYYSGSSWARMAVPAGLVSLSSSDSNYFAATEDEVWRGGRDGLNFDPIGSPTSQISQIESAHARTAVLSDGGEIWVRRNGRSGWQTYPEPLAGVVQIAMDDKHIYALTNAGSVHRSRLIGESGWDAYGSYGNVGSIGTTSRHAEQLLFSVGDIIYSVDGSTWSSDLPPIIIGWAASGWVAEGWAE